MIKRLPCFDIITKSRLPILKALVDRELDNGEVATIANIKRPAAFWHLKILAKHGLVSETEERKLNASGRTKNIYRKIKRYALTLQGQQAIEYFSSRGV